MLAAGRRLGAPAQRHGRNGHGPNRQGWFRRLEAAPGSGPARRPVPAEGVPILASVDEGDRDRIAEEHRTLVRWIDKAAARGALHRNAAARKKAQALQCRA